MRICVRAHDLLDQWRNSVAPGGKTLNGAATFPPLADPLSSLLRLSYYIC